MRRDYVFRKPWTPFLLIAPATLLILGIFLFPIFYGLFMSFRRYYLLQALGGKIPFVGFHNYRLLVEDPYFWLAVWNTLIWAASVTSISIGVSLVFALLLNQRFRFRGLARTAVLLPWVVPIAAAAVVWGIMYNDRYGVINLLLSEVFKIGYFKNLFWLGNLQTSLIAVIIVQIWKVFPFFAVTILAAMQSISQDQYEAANIDGASFLQQFRYVTLPGIRPILVILILLSLIWSFNAFTTIYILTGGGPMHSSEVLGILAYNTAFIFNRLGRSCAVGVIMLIILLILSAIYFRVVPKEEGGVRP